MHCTLLKLLYVYLYASVSVSLNNPVLSALTDPVDLPLHFAVLTITFIYKARRFNFY